MNQFERELTVGQHRLLVPGESAAAWLAHEFADPDVYQCAAEPTISRVVDCGANVGAATSLFLQRYPNCHVVCVEPDPATFEYLRTNLTRSGVADRVQLVNAAASNAAGTSTFYTSKVGADYSLRMSLDEFRMGAVGRGITVATVDIADLVGAHTDILKLDVEGAEFALVVRLAQTGALQRIDHLVIEAHHYPERPPRIGRLLAAIEDGGFALRIAAAPVSGAGGEACQDIMVVARNRAPRAAMIT
ncbi:MAG: FkbM family methyltransferase [Solirubrobacteraceae bacterium]